MKPIVPSPIATSNVPEPVSKDTLPQSKESQGETKAPPSPKMQPQPQQVAVMKKAQPPTQSYVQSGLGISGVSLLSRECQIKNRNYQVIAKTRKE